MERRQVLLERRAARDLAKLPPALRRRLERGLEELSLDPYRSRPGCDVRRLQGDPGRLALRVGKYRAIFEVEGNPIRVLACAHRSVAYR